MSKTVFILEDTNIVPNNELKIIQEMRDPSGELSKVAMRAKLQDDQLNGNRRIYNKSVLQEIVNQMQPKAKNRSLLMEMNHPFYNGNPEDFKRRAVNIDLDNICAVCRNIWVESDHTGLNVYGEIESLSDGKGPRFRNYIVNDKLDIGFSLRMLGSVNPHPTMEGVSVVAPSLKAVTYDVVSNPSHKGAKMITFITENTHEYLGAFDMYTNSVLTESTSQEMQLIDNLQLPDTAEKTIRDYVSILVENSVKNFSKTLQFKLS